MGWRDTIKKDSQGSPKSWRDTIRKDPEAVPMADSVVRGVSDGASFGFDDEIGGALEAVGSKVGVRGLGGSFSDIRLESPEEDKQDFSEVYASIRDKRRDDKLQARDSNPGTYMASQIGGGIGTAVAGPASLAGKMALSAGEGFVSGIGSSESDDMSGIAKDALGSGAISAVMPAAFAGLGKAAKGVADFGKETIKKTAGAASGMPDEALEWYMSRRDKVNSARPIGDVSKSMMDTIDNLRDEVVSGSAKSRNILADEGQTIPKETLVNFLDDNISKLQADGAFTDQAERGLNTLMKMKSRLVEESVDDAGERLTRFPDQMPTNQAKNFLQQLDDVITFSKSKPGEFSSASNSAMSKIRHATDSELKGISPAYAKQMEQVSADTRLLGDVSSSFRTPEGLNKQLQQIAIDPDIMRADKFKALDDRMGTDVTNDLRDSWVNEQFSKSQTRGARSVAHGQAIGEAIGDRIPGGRFVGKALGSAVGHVQDKYGNQFVKKGMDTYLDHIQSKVPNLSPKYQQIFQDAARRGGNAVAVTHFLLSGQDETYRKSLEDEENN